ncbi:MAG: universal stress protein, partial [Natronospirillum sp.]
MSKIIAGIDGSQAALAVCDAAAWASKQLNATVLVLHVLDKSEFPAERDLSGNLGLGAREQLLAELSELDNKRSKLALEQGKLQLNAARDRLEADGIVSVETLQRHDSLTDTVESLEVDTRLLIMGRKGEAHENDLQTVGGHLENVIRIAKKPLLITVEAFAAPKRFLLAFDGSKTAQAALERVAGSPLLQGLPCHLVMVGTATEERQLQLEEAKKTLTD